MCGIALDQKGFHAATDQTGGGLLTRHTRLAKSVGGLISRWLDVKPRFEQRVPAWDRPSTRVGGAAIGIEQAVLDLEFVGPSGRTYIDVTVRHPAAGGAAAVRAAARKDGEATSRAERQKNERYPGPLLTPFVVETPGRLGAEARLWLLKHVRELPVEQQAKELTRAYQVVSCAVQGTVASQLRKAAGLK